VNRKKTEDPTLNGQGNILFPISLSFLPGLCILNLFHIEFSLKLTLIEIELNAVDSKEVR
jgi:hypothetical protein